MKSKIEFDGEIARVTLELSKTELCIIDHCLKAKGLNYPFGSLTQITQNMIQETSRIIEDELWGSR